MFRMYANFIKNKLPLLFFLYVGITAIITVAATSVLLYGIYFDTKMLYKNSAEVPCIFLSIISGCCFLFMCSWLANKLSLQRTMYVAVLSGYMFFTIIVAYLLYPNWSFYKVVLIFLCTVLSLFLLLFIGSWIFKKVQSNLRLVLITLFSILSIPVVVANVMLIFTTLLSGYIALTSTKQTLASPALAPYWNEIKRECNQKYQFPIEEIFDGEIENCFFAPDKDGNKILELLKTKSGSTEWTLKCSFVGDSTKIYRCVIGFHKVHNDGAFESVCITLSDLSEAKNTLMYMFNNKSEKLTLPQALEKIKELEKEL